MRKAITPMLLPFPTDGNVKFKAIVEEEIAHFLLSYPKFTSSCIDLTLEVDYFSEYFNSRMVTML